MALILCGVANYSFIIHRTQRLRLIKVQIYLESGSLDLFEFRVADALTEDQRLISSIPYLYIQVNLCQKLLFFHQLTHNMTTDRLLNYEFST